MNELKCKIGENLRTRLYNQSQNHPRHVLVTRKGLVKMSASEPWLAAPGELLFLCRNSGWRSLAVAESLGARPTAGQCWWCRQAEGGVCGGANAPKCCFLDVERSVCPPRLQRLCFSSSDKSLFAEHFPPCVCFHSLLGLLALSLMVCFLTGEKKELNKKFKTIS